MAEAKIKRTVKHPRLYLRVYDKVQHVEAGTVVTVTKTQADRLGDKLTKKNDRESIDVTPKPDDAAKAAAEAHAKATAKK